MNTGGQKPRAGGGGLHRLAEPAPVEVGVDGAGSPEQVAGRKVIAIRESWLVEDRWWTSEPIRRHYWEVVDERGAVCVVFRQPGNRWLVHR
ncbi:MAG: hypothetical protein F2799_00700 [Actinobacteria bacterium]|uniref:Unannotated protein n=1 Tax=freshwater metagenome TaxID=449393 RepID=A0A6J7CUT5_9ZZZZ|nr:hypothetical protein [Actinomycetota bacterium]